MPTPTDELRTLDERVRLHLTGDDGACFDTDGKRIDGKPWWTCLCEFGAKTNYKYAQAIAEVARVQNASDGVSWPGGEDAREVAWDKREGQPWQTDIEAHVRAYHETPPPYSSDIALAMGLSTALRDKSDRSKDFAMTLHETAPREDVWVACFTNWNIKKYFGRGYSPAESVCRAYVAACEEKEVALA